MPVLGVISIVVPPPALRICSIAVLPMRTTDVAPSTITHCIVTSIPFSHLDDQVAIANDLQLGAVGTGQRLFQFEETLVDQKMFQLPSRDTRRGVPRVAVEHYGNPGDSARYILLPYTKHEARHAADDQPSFEDGVHLRRPLGGC
jgi:hypothetical protein